MARRFLYIVAGLVVLVFAGLLLLRLFADDLSELAFVPDAPFTEQAALPADAYADTDLWISRPGLGADDPALWMPEGLTEDADALGAAVFFVHPTSYFGTKAWNAPLDDAEAREQAAQFVREMATPFNKSVDIWAPRYRQATLGAFLTDKPEAQQALDAAYGDVAQAFDQFIATVSPDRPIVLAGHSQGAFHLRRLIAEKVAGTPLQQRIAAAYLVGWPVSKARDLPQLGLPACTAPEQAGCIASWQSWAEPADYGKLFVNADARGWLDGSQEDGRPYLCSNPLAGMGSADANASANAGTLRRDEKAESWSLIKGAVPARCSAEGLLLIGDPPEMGNLVMPGNNYHVYDIPLFWANLRADVAQRVKAWQATR